MVCTVVTGMVCTVVTGMVCMHCGDWHGMYALW
jgi:hypothetical protein